MKKLTILILLISCFYSRGGQTVGKEYLDNFPSILPRIELQERKEKVLLAIIKYESKGNPKAYNKAEDAMGILQIRKIYVDECNRILKKKVFSYEDRKDPEKSKQMFQVVMDYHAPDYSLDNVCMIHNAGKISAWSMRVTKSYRNKVNEIYNQLKV